ncbi:hypothetical protein V495_05957 [Pseudogymnoascus sp. VKM F-4514 (FW-929)]|nr:hypothetical protein V495_05957 [Pseudogymnoascus sp. VKM F-4514 (FW-929)]KFY57821.1 hypothetical protein V497_05225 [Pseudogymnoascus sp. VKM F-4516 (FW-969)]
MLGDSTHYDPATYNDPEESRDDKHLIGNRGHASPVPPITVSPDLQQARTTFMSSNKGFMTNEKSSSDQPTFGRPIYIARLCLRILSLVLSLGVVGLVASVMARHAQTKDIRVTNPHTGLEYRVWPLNTNYIPSNLLLGAASIASLLSLGLVVASFTKSVRRLTKVGAISTLCVSITATVLWIAATTYFKLWDSKKKTWFDLWSWTCTHKSSFKANGVDMAPLCLQMRVAWYIAVAVAAVEILAIGTCILALVKGKKTYQALGAEGLRFR